MKTIESHNFSMTLPTGLIEGTIRAEIRDYDDDDMKEVLDWIEVDATWMPYDTNDSVIPVTDMETFMEILDDERKRTLDEIILGF